MYLESQRRTVLAVPEGTQLSLPPSSVGIKSAHACSYYAHGLDQVSILLESDLHCC